MLIESKKIQDDLGFRSSWISARFQHIAEEGTIYGCRSRYNVDKMLEYAKIYKSSTMNPIQAERSMRMMKRLIKYLEEFKLQRLKESK